MADFGLSLLVAAGTQLLMSALAPTQEIEGPRLDDLRAPASQYGKAIPKIYGTARVTGNLVWAENIKEKKKKQQSGGKGGGPTTTTYTYFGTFAILLCEGIVELKKIWLNGNLVYNTDSTDSQTIAASNKFADNFSFYPGNSAQTPNSRIQAKEGVENTPAFRGKSYIVFYDLPLADYGNTFPTVSCLVQSTADDGLESCIRDLCKRAGLESSDLDLTEIKDDLIGFVAAQDGETYRSNIEQLQQIYFLYLVEGYDGKLAFRYYNRPAIKKNIPQEDLATHDLNEKIPDLYQEIRGQSADLPTQLNVTYNNLNLDYDKDNQTAVKEGTLNNNQRQINTTLTLNKTKARTALYRVLQQLWIQRTRFESIKLPSRYLGEIEPGDVITLPIRGQEIPIQVQQIDIGVNCILELKGTLYDAAPYQVAPLIPELPRFDGIITSPIFAGSAELILLDIPLIKDTDQEKAIYATVQSPSPNWSYGEVYYSSDTENFDLVTTFNQEGTVGETVNVLGTVSPYVVDRYNKIVVDLSNGTLESVTDSDFYKLKNLALIGNEIVAFKNAELIFNNRYRLSTLIRGCKGTEWAIPLHAANDSFVLLQGQDAYIEQIVGSELLLGQELEFKLITPPEELAEVTPQNLTISGQALKPYAPCQFKYEFLNNESLRFTWQRRSRKNGEWLDIVEELPLNEDSENYEIDIGSPALKTLTTSTTSVIFSASDQVLLYGATIKPNDYTAINLQIKIYQLSTLVGRGTPLEINGLQ